MKKSHLFILALSATVFSCKKANITEVRPFDNSFTDSTKVLLVKDKYPCMKLLTDKAIHLQVAEEGKGNDENLHIKTSLRFLSLETTEESLIGQINKLESDESFIFIFDRSNQSILRFSQLDGSFLNKFGSKGRGPGEFIEITDMSLNRKKKEVCLIDFSLFKLMFFNYDGMLLREEPLYYIYNKMEFIGNRIIAHTEFNENTKTPSVNNNRLVLAETDQTPLYVGFAFPEGFKDKFSQSSKHALVTCNEEVYYNHVLSDTIWQIKENGDCEAKYILKFPGRDNLFSETDFQRITDDEYKEKQRGIPYYRDELAITKDFVKAEPYGASELLYCISTGHYAYGGATYKLFGKPTSTREAKFTLNGTSFVRVLQPFEIYKELEFLKNLLTEKQYNHYMENQLTEEERQLLTKMDKEDNPVLLIIDIEPF